jgi:hypothetical protein
MTSKHIRRLKDNSEVKDMVVKANKLMVKARAGRIHRWINTGSDFRVNYDDLPIEAQNKIRYLLGDVISLIEMSEPISKEIVLMKDGEIVKEGQNRID